jgi:hypothetical protein
VSASERRTVVELLDDSDGLAREALLDMSADRALGMVRGWPQLMQSAAELWVVLPADPAVSANADPMAILAAMGPGRWPQPHRRTLAGRGPSDEAWEQIASNFAQARRLLQEQLVASEALSSDGQFGPASAKTQILHAHPRPETSHGGSAPRAPPNPGVSDQFADCARRRGTVTAAFAELYVRRNVRDRG